MPARPTSLIQWSLAYGVTAFATGFLFGALRELVFIPRWGERIGHWAEFPLVTVCIVAIGLWIGRRATPSPLAIGLAGAAVLAVLEGTLAIGVFLTPPGDYLAQYDVTRGSLFPFGLAAMAIAPLAGRRLP